MMQVTRCTNWITETQGTDCRGYESGETLKRAAVAAETDAAAHAEVMQTAVWRRQNRHQQQRLWQQQWHTCQVPIMMRDMSVPPIETVGSQSRSTLASACMCRSGDLSMMLTGPRPWTTHCF